MYPSLCDKTLYRFIPEEPPISLDALKSRYKELEKAQCPDMNEVWLNWIIFLRSERAAIGYVQATVNTVTTSQIAYMVFSSFQRQGFATEALSVLLEEIFNAFQIDSLKALIDSRNEASIAVVSNLGFSLVDTIECADYFKGSSSDEYRFSLSRKDWKPPCYTVLA